jgi:hypothetical protein
LGPDRRLRQLSDTTVNSQSRRFGHVRTLSISTTASSLNGGSSESPVNSSSVAWSSRSRWCAQCRAESLNEDPITMRDCIRLCSECLELCRTCVALRTGSSAFAHGLCGICSELCTACASECGKYDSETMRKCAQACLQCAATCAEVAQGGPIRRAAA